MGWDELRGQKIFNPVNIVRSVWNCRAELAIWNPPINSMVVVEEDAGELAGGAEVSPVDRRTASPRGDEDEGLEGGVERGEDREIWRLC